MYDLEEIRRKVSLVALAEEAVRVSRMSTGCQAAAHYPGMQAIEITLPLFTSMMVGGDGNASRAVRQERTAAIFSPFT
jgi:hypothetical protein